ncbi:MAG TPA: glycoside hydrolase family 3 N-terminal domain-containing protein [Fimbriimonadaceae bacterium]|nr:glycoside hydrolase family 3 N-terminal domain-containing protein [Fimbriimonadaceae bacterium]
MLLIVLGLAAQLAIPDSIALSERPPTTSVPSVYPAKSEIYRDGWIDLDKNGRKDVYEDPKQPIERRIDDLLRRMTLEEKTCQCATLYGYPNVLKDRLPTRKWTSEIWKDGIANIDEQMNGNFNTPEDLTYYWPPSSHAAAMNEIQRFFIEQTQLGIPVDFTNEGIKGVAAFKTTDFPIPLGLGATWDRVLVRKVGEITGSEGRLMGFTNVYAPILDVLRDPRWGRTEESFGESPWLVARMGVELCKGMQSNGVASTAKHYAVYSFDKGAREGESRTDPRATPREVEEISLLPFKDAIREAGLLGVMASYNDYDGEPVIASPHFLTDKLRKEFGFRGYVVSDSGAVEYVWQKHGVAKDLKDAVRRVMLAGLNVRTQFDSPAVFIDPLRELVKSGELPMKVLDSRVRDVLRVKFMLGLFDRPYRDHLEDADHLVASPENQAVALRASRESLVLLKNENHALPFAGTGTLAVIGPNATNVDWELKRYGPTKAEPTSILDGIKAVAPVGTKVLYAKGCDIVDKGFPDSELVPTPLTEAEQTEIDKAVAAAREADRVVLVLGDSNRTSGESRSRTSLDLPGRQLDLARAIAATGKPVVAVVVGGRPMTINWLAQNVPAILYAFSPGSHAGQAIAEALFGVVDPGGKLNCTFPKSVGQLPLNFPTKPLANDERLRTKTGVSGPLYPFGFGLSYTTFAYSDLEVSPQHVKPGESVTVSFTVTNTGDREGDEVPQLYTRQVVSSVTTYEKNLRGFDRITLKPGEGKRVQMVLTPHDLEIVDAKMKWTVEPGEFRVMIGSSSEDIRLKSSFWYGS